MENESIAPTTPIYTLKVAAKLSNTSVYSIRQYVDKGLILPYCTRTHRHLYSQVDILGLRCIRRYLDEFGLNIAGIKALLAMLPCWLLKPCPSDDRSRCDAYISLTKPCWQVAVKGATCKQADCRTCKVYKDFQRGGDAKSLFKKLAERQLDSIKSGPNNEGLAGLSR